MSLKIRQLRILVILVILFSSLGYASLASVESSETTINEPMSPVKLSLNSDLTHHDRIIIVNDTDFSYQAGNEGWSGDGSPSLPFIIENYLINGSAGNRISIYNTRVHFNIQNCELRNANDAGVYLYNVSNGKITENLITNSDYGIECHNISSNNIVDNSFVDNREYGLAIMGSSNGNTIANNSISNQETGIYIAYSFEITLFNNSILESDLSGIDLWRVTDTTISENNISKASEFGIYFRESVNNTIHFNTLWGCGIGFLYDLPLAYYMQTSVIGNSVNGKSLAYYHDQTSLSISSMNTLGQIILVNCNESEIRNQILNNCSVGISLFHSHQNTIEDIQITDSYLGGVIIYQSHGNTFENIRVSGCGSEYVDIDWPHWIHGVEIHSSDNNTIVNSIVSENEIGGIQNKFSDGTIVEHCTISNNGDSGLVFFWSQNVTLFNNTISFNVGTGIVINGFGRNVYFDIRSNIFRNNSGYGLFLSGADSCRIEENLCVNNTIGIGIFSSDSNILTNNTIYGGSCLEVGGSENNQIIWNEFIARYDEIGSWWSGSGLYLIDNNFDYNYYSNYDGTDLDNDGIGDDPYEVGSGAYDNHPVMLPRNSSPIFLDEPPSQLSFIDTILHDLDATARPPGIDYWWISDTINFDIDDFGVITNTSQISPGTYELEVRAYDHENQFCSATISITFSLTPEPTPTTPTSTPPIPFEFIIIAGVLIGVVAAVVVVVSIYRRKSN